MCCHVRTELKGKMQTECLQMQFQVEIFFSYLLSEPVNFERIWYEREKNKKKKNQRFLHKTFDDLKVIRI